MKIVQTEAVERERTPHEKLGVALILSAVKDGDAAWIYGPPVGPLYAELVCMALGVNLEILRERFPEVVKDEIRRVRLVSSKYPKRRKANNKHIKKFLEPGLKLALFERARWRGEALQQARRKA